MRIESINLDKEDFEHMASGSGRNMPVDLAPLPMDKPLRMQNLGKCVIVAGKNGAGKTRLLKLVEQIAERYLTKEQREDIELTVEKKKDEQENSEREAERIRREGSRPIEGADGQQRYERSAASANPEVVELKKTLKLGSALSIQGVGKPKIVSFVPRSTELKDPMSMTDLDANSQAESFATTPFAQYPQGEATAYARKIMRKGLHEKTSSNGESQSKLNQRAEKELHELFQMLLGKEAQLELSDDYNLKLLGLPDKDFSSLLSDGQKVIFQYACKLHARQASLHDCVVFLDEPENHLHPAVLNEIVDRLQELLTDGQLWIATHSVPLIAHLSAQDTNCLWFAEEGRFTPAGRSPEKVLDSLLGGPEGARRVNDLTLLPSRFASLLFLRQCLLNPDVIGYSKGDQQLEQIREELDRLRAQKKQPLTIIDFGSGKGRLLDAIAQETEHRPLKEVVDYLAYEPHASDAKECQHLCLELYGPDENKQRVFSDLANLKSQRGIKFADVAVVCNVLHEVHPDYWIRDFGGESALSSLLKDDGFILFIEDYALPTGERAHEFGFLLLDQEQLIELFGITSVDIDSNRFTRNDHQNPKYQGRLIAHLVSAQCLGRMTEKTQKRAIESLQEQSLKRLKQLLANCNNGEAGTKHGRESALVTQLAANAALWIREKENRTNPKGNDGYV